MHRVTRAAVVAVALGLLLSEAWAADRILGTTNGEGTTEELTPTEAKGLIGVPEGLDANFSLNPQITGATTGNPMRVGSNVSAQTDVCTGTDGTLGGVIKPCTDADTRTYIWTNFTWCLFDVEGGSCVIKVDPDAATRYDEYQFFTGHLPLKSFWVGAGGVDGDGTNCPATATTVTINSGPRMPTIICGSGANGDLDFTVGMPYDWDASSLFVEPVYIQTAANTSAMNSDIKAQCRGTGEALSSTWGSSVAIDDTNVTGSNAQDTTRSGAITPAGTCSRGDLVSFRWTLDVTGTTTPESTLHILGFRVLYSQKSLSN